MPKFKLRLELVVLQATAVNAVTARDPLLDSILNEAIEAEDLSAFAICGARGPMVLATTEVHIRYEWDGPNVHVSESVDSRFGSATSFSRFGDEEPDRSLCPVWQQACGTLMKVIESRGLSVVWYVRFLRRGDYYSMKYGLGVWTFTDMTVGGETFEAENSRVSDMHLMARFSREVL